MTFDADLDLFDDIDRSKSNRKIVQKILQDNANYLRIKDDSKAPSSSFAKGRRNRLKNVPKDGNYGIIPDKRLFILDFDCHNKGFSSIDEQIDFFSKFFGINIRNSFSVVTQTGGIHVYLLFPYDVEEIDSETFPKASLRSYSDAFSYIEGVEIKLDADIRSGLVNGYVIGPESSVPVNNPIHEKYWIADNTVGFDSFGNFEILEVSHESVEKLQKVVDLKHQLMYKTVDELDREKYEEALLELSLNSDNDPDEKTKTKPSADVLSRLRKAIKDKDLGVFHIKRAFVKSALHCCYDDYAIAIACIEIGVDKDSYTKKSIGFRALMADLKRFNPERRYHGFYCDKGRRNFRSLKEAENRIKYNDKEFDVELFRKKIEEKIAKRSLFNNGFRNINPRVLDVGKISRSILSEKRYMNPPQQYFDAMAIVDYFLQPLSNVGVSRIILARTAICERLNISSSRVAQALRLLRSNNIIILEEKQKSGLAPKYSIPENFTQNYLTKTLKSTWGFTNKGLAREESDSLFFDRVEGVFKKVFTNESIKPVTSLNNALLNLNKGIPDVNFRHYSAGAALFYLKAEAKRNDIEPRVVQGSIINENNGEILVE